MGQFAGKKDDNKEKEKVKHPLPPLSRPEIEQIIEDWIFNERARKMLKRRWFDGVTIERLAEEYDLSVRQTNNILRKAREEVFKHFPKSAQE